MIQSAHRIRSYKQADLQMGLTSGGIEGLHAVVLDEDEERVLHLPRRELEAADDLLQRQRAVAEQAAAHLLREGIGRRRLGHTSTRRRRRSARGGGEYEANDGRGGGREKGGEAYGYEGAEVVGDDGDGEEDPVLRHHGRRRRGLAPPRLNPRGKGGEKGVGMGVVGV